MANTVADAVASDTGAISSLSLSDPYEIAYLRGGADEVLRLGLYELHQLGHLVVVEQECWLSKKRWLATAPDAPSTETLSPLLRSLRSFCRVPLLPKEIFQLALPAELVAESKHYRRSLQQRGWLAGWVGKEGPAYDLVRLLRWVVFGLCLYLYVTLDLKFNLLFVIFGCLFLSELAVAPLCHRANKQGRQMLKQLEERYATYREFDAAAWAGTSPSIRLAAVAVLGCGILAQTPADALAAVLGGTSGGVSYSVESGCGGCGGCGG